MKSELLIKKLGGLGKEFYTLDDLAIVTGEPRNYLRVALTRLTKKGLLRRIFKNIYVEQGRVINYELIAEQYDPDSYLSFESALYQYGILDQIPQTITLATNKKSRSFDFENQIILFRKMQARLFGNYVIENNLRIATPEKALLDMLYIISLGRAALPLDELDLKKIDREAVKKNSRYFPEKTRRLLAKLGL